MATTIKKGSQYFQAVTYTGTGSQQSISSLSFRPDLIWIKQRNDPDNHVIFDSLRTGSTELYGNLQNAESASTGALVSINSNGFTLGASGDLGRYNENNSTYVAWCWKAGDSAVSNGDGSITSQVSANPTAGFSIVSYTGNATGGATVGHGLGKTPKLIVVKNRQTGSTDWLTLHTEIGLTGDTSYSSPEYYMIGMNQAQARQNYTADLILAPTTTTFKLGAAGSGYSNASANYIAYVWAEIEGYSKISSYTGNGSSNGPFVYCGFRPSYIMVKNTAAGYNWRIFDTSRSTRNVTVGLLESSTSSSEYTDSGNWDYDIVSNGFKIRNTGGMNGNNENHIFMAFAENPFKYANAR